jgi:hypothetical protein
VRVTAAQCATASTSTVPPVPCAASHARVRWTAGSTRARTRPSPALGPRRSWPRRQPASAPSTLAVAATEIGTTAGVADAADHTPRATSIVVPGSSTPSTTPLSSASTTPATASTSGAGQLPIASSTAFSTAALPSSSPARFRGPTGLSLLRDEESSQGGSPGPHPPGVVLDRAFGAEG